jgi:hypothetical protein
MGLVVFENDIKTVYGSGDKFIFREKIVVVKFEAVCF